MVIRLMTSRYTWKKLQAEEAGSFMFDLVNSTMDSLEEVRRRMDKPVWKDIYSALLRCRQNILNVNPEEYAAGHLPTSLSAPGGQLIQATDKWAGTYRSRLVLVDNNGVRATMTASWLIQMGWPHVFVLKDGLDNIPLEKGVQQAPVVPVENTVQLIAPEDLQIQLKSGSVTVMDFATSLDYKAAHITGAWWAVRSRLEGSLSSVPGDGPLVFTSPDGVLAAYAASDC